jgi:hypothetical protein
MDTLVLAPSGAKVLRAMIISCGNRECFKAAEILDSVTAEMPFLEVALNKEGAWHMKAHERLYNFCQKKKIRTINAFEAAWYFGGSEHIEIMKRYGGHAGLGEFLGADAGLVSHTLLPLGSELIYENSGKKIQFQKFVDLGGDGVPCFHLGVVVRIPLSESEVSVIKDEQSANKDFMNALLKCGDTIVPPHEYFEALNCTATSARNK